MEETPTSGLTDKQLKFSYWYVSHKLSLKRGLVVFLVCACVALWVFVGWGLAQHVMDYRQIEQTESRLLFSGDPSLARIEAMAPRELSVSDVQVFAAGEAYDYLASINNANADWLAQFDYRFAGNASSSVVRRGFVLPQSTGNLMEFAQSNSDTSLQITDLKWRRIGNYQAIKSAMDAFDVSNAKLTASASKDQPSVLTFDLANLSPYSYWSVDAQVMLYNAGVLVGISHLPVNQFMAGQTRQVSLFWNYPLPSGVDYVITPVTNFLDSDNIMPVAKN